jgi:DNA-binding response OmpR family regulator
MTVLYIDDDPDDSEFAVEALSNVDDTIKCLVFTKAKDALQFLLETDELPDFIFLDINMPLMNGKQCLLKIKAEPKLKDIPVVMCSTTLQTSEMKVYFEMGVYDFIVKPNTIEKMRIEMQAIIESRQSELFNNR